MEKVMWNRVKMETNIKSAAESQEIECAKTILKKK